MVTYCGVHGGGFWCGECKDMNIVMASISIGISTGSIVVVCMIIAVEKF